MKFKKLILFSIILIFLILFLRAKQIKNETIITAEYDEEGKLLENIKYKTEDLNVIFIISDALRADHLGCYGYERDTSPNIDKFAQENLMFEKAYVQWPRTIPSMTSMFSSTYAHTNNIMKTEKISEKLVMLAEILKNNDYQTFAAVNNPVLKKEFSINQGFDEHIIIGENKTSRRLSDAQNLTETTINWIEKNKDKKFFTWLHYMDPHAPYNSAFNNPEHDLFVEDKYFNKINRHAPISNSASMGVIPKGVNLQNFTYLDFYVSQYDAEIHYTDKWIGKLLEYLDKSGLKENTLIIFTADHGESLSDHNYLFNHGAFAYDASVHVPLIISYSKFEKGKINTPIPSIDLTPTILDILNIPLSNTFEGHSLLPLIYENISQNKFVFSEARDIPHNKLNNIYSISIRDDRFKLIKNSWKISDTKMRTQNYHEMKRLPSGEFSVEMFTLPSYEFYDMINDPGEINNLAYIENNIEYNKIKVTLLEELDIWFKNAKKGVYLSEGIPTLDEDQLNLLKSLGYLN